jgi:hypothetical protein
MLKNLKKADFDPSLLHVAINDIELKDDYKLKPLIETNKCRHWQLRSLSLTSCQLKDKQFCYLIREMHNRGKKLEALEALEEVIRDPQDWPHLNSLNFSRNRLKDDGVKELANVVFKRAQNS